MSRVPLEQFGRDHDSTLLYIETLNVDRRGVPELARMRCDPKLHPGLAGLHVALLEAAGSPKSPTRLKDGSTLDDHDDWSCVEDMEAAGLVTWAGTGMHPVLLLTEAGWARAHALRREMAARRAKVPA